MFFLRLEDITDYRLAGFRPQQFAVTIDTAPVPIDELHRVAAHGTFRRGPLVDVRELGQFKIVVVIDHTNLLPLLARFHFQQQRFFGALAARNTDER